MALTVSENLKYRLTSSGEWQPLLLNTDVGVPGGGSTGQFLTKKTNTNYDTEWSQGTVGSSTTPIYLSNGVLTSTGIPINMLSKLAIYKADILSDDWTYYSDNTVVDETTYANKWYFQKYSSITMTEAALETLNGMTPNLLNYYLDSATSITMNIADSYSAKCTTYLYCQEDCTVLMKFETDDAGEVYLNGEFICSITSCTWTAVQELSFHAGENELIICYTEGSGGDGWICDPKPSTLVGDTFLAMSGVKLGGYTQTVTPIKVAGNGTITANTILFHLSTSASTTEAIQNGSILYTHTNSFANANGTITLKTTDNLKTVLNLTVYWITYDTT